MQKKLRAELLAVSESTPDASVSLVFLPSPIPPPKPLTHVILSSLLFSSRSDQLSALPYLDAVVREALRLYAPVTSTVRVATKDVDTIPLSTPVIGRDGKEMNEIQIGKGVSIFIRELDRSIDSFVKRRPLMTSPFLSQQLS